MSLFLQEKINRLSCSNCQFKNNRASDITLRDCRGIWNYEHGLDTDKGVSLSLTNSEAGSSFLNAKRLNIIALDECDFLANNSSYIKSFQPDKNKSVIIKRELTGDNS